MSTEDHPDWWKNVGGSNALDSMLERRSLVSNDNGIEDGTVPALSFVAELDIGKFFSRGMRGKIERVEVYGESTPMVTTGFRISPHPCLGPIHDIDINIGPGWAWYGVDIEEMWDYDSLFIWCRGLTAWTFIGYDEVQPHDDHQSPDAGATWADLPNRLFIRLIYTSETPGDVPVSGIINNIPIPYASSEEAAAGVAIGANTVTNIVTIDGIGYCDYILFQAAAQPSSHLTEIQVVADGVRCFAENFNTISTWGFVAATPGLSLLSFGADALCVLLFTKRFEFRRILEIDAFNLPAVATVTVLAIPNLLR